MSTPLTDEQIENWRRVMVSIIGPYALVMPKAEIQILRDRMQAKANEIELTDPARPAAETAQKE